jgi:transformation/transcription domain-associated protein
VIQHRHIYISSLKIINIVFALCPHILPVLVSGLILSSYSAAVQVRLQLAMEVRDSLEMTHTPDYLNFLRCYFRAFSAILTNYTQPQATENAEHKLRNVVIEILNRLPHSEVLRPFVQDLLKLSLRVLTQDNEDNALLAIRIVFDLLRNFRPTVEAEVQPFLDFVIAIYRNFPTTVTYFFDNPNAAVPIQHLDPTVDAPGTMTVPGGGQLNPSALSFKIVTESPLVVMFLFQLYAKLVQTNIPYLLPLMVSAISIKGPDKVPPHLKTPFNDLKGAQVKVGPSLYILVTFSLWFVMKCWFSLQTLSFLMYLLKSNADYIKSYEESICKSIVNLLVTCPPDSVSIRKARTGLELCKIHVIICTLL